MSARIGPFDTKVAIVAGSDPTWHGFEIQVPPEATCAEVAQLIGADYKVRVTPAIAVRGDDGETVEILGGGRQVLTELTAPADDCPDSDIDEDLVQELREMEANGEEPPKLRVLGHVGTDYEPIQNGDLAEVLDQFMASARAYVEEHPDCGLVLPSFETMGTLNNRRRFWAMIKLGGFDIAIPHQKPEGDQDAGVEQPDRIMAYLLVTTSHDGKSLASVSVVFVRVVCNNTLTAAMDTEQRVFSIKHTGMVKVKLENVSRSLEWLVKTIGDARERMQQMVNSPLTDEEAALVTAYFFGAGPRLAWIRDHVTGLWSGEGLRGAELAPANTVWRYLQALTQTIAETQGGKDVKGETAEGLAATARVSNDWRGVKYTPTAATALCAGLVCDRDRLMKLAREAAAKSKKGKDDADEAGNGSGDILDS